jgi:hypothetical protein
MLITERMACLHVGLRVLDGGPAVSQPRRNVESARHL